MVFVEDSYVAERVLKEHCTVLQQGATIARQQMQIEALTAGLQKVSAQPELNKPVPQTRGEAVAVFMIA